MAPVLTIKLLGGFGLSVGDRDLPSLQSRAASSLLAFLVLQRDRAQTRDLLAGRFWSDLPEDKARKQLTQQVWRIRSVVNKALGDDADILLVTNRDLRINPDIEIDTDIGAFVDGLDQLDRRNRGGRRGPSIDELSAVIELYRGDLLAGYYDEWIEPYRNEYHRRYLDALARLAKMHAQTGDFEAALRCSQALVAAEPLADQWQRDVIRYYALNGQPTAAEQYYQRYVDELQREVPGAQPPAETAALVQRIRDEAAELAAPPPVEEGPTLALVGREQERALLLDRVNGLLDGRGGVVLVEGEAGIGKSRLMDEVVSGAEWRDVQVLRAGHDQAGSLTPFGGLKDALAPVVGGLRGERLSTQLAPVWLRQASSVLPGLAALVEGRGGDQSLRPQEEPWRTIEALSLVILAQGAPNPTVLVLEDVHWCDDDTVQVLTQLGDRLAESGVLLCLTYQRHQAQESEALWRALGVLEAKPGSTRLGLRPLTAAEVRALAAAELGTGQLSEPALEQLVASSNGNPYVVLELLRSSGGALDEDFFAGALEPSHEADSVLPWLRSALSKRIDAAPPTVRLVLECVAVIGVPASASVVAKAAQLGRSETVDALAEAVAAGFLVEVGRGVDFAQQQTRSLVYDDLDRHRLTELHGRVVDGLVANGEGAVEQLAFHADRAGQWARAYQYHSLAAESAVELNAFQTAAEHFSRSDLAAEEIGLADADRVDDVLAYEAVLNVLGRRDEQQALLTRLSSSLDDPALVVEWEQRRAWLLANTDRAAEAAQRASEAAVVAEAAGQNTGELLTVVGVGRYWAGDLHGALEPFNKAIDVLNASGRSSAMAEIMLGRTLVDLLRTDEARARLEAAYEQAKANHDAREQVEALNHLATLFHFQHDEVRAEAAFLEALDLAVDIGYRHGEGLNLVNLAAFYTLSGRGGKALPLVQQAEKVFSSLGNGRGVAYAKNNSAELLHWLGDDDSAVAQAEDAAVYFRSVEDPKMEAMALITLASIDRRRGRRRLARRRLEAARRQSDAADDPLTLATIHVNVALVELELNHLEAAWTEAGVAAALTKEHDELSTLAGAVAAVEARILREQGRNDQALERANKAVTLNRPTSYQAHLTAWWCAEIFEVHEAAEAAREQIALAHQILLRTFEDLTDDLRAKAWSVPEHRAIAAGRERHFIDQGEWRLPRLDAPTGRPLEDHEYVDVVWTVSDPGDHERRQPSAVRQHRIRRLAEQARNQGARVRVSDLSLVLGVSERTIKRDLARIREIVDDPSLPPENPGDD